MLAVLEHTLVGEFNRYNISQTLFCLRQARTSTLAYLLPNNLALRAPTVF
jgi:hypothetical protein